MTRSFSINAAVFIALIALGAASRLAGLGPNFAAVAACALFAGFFFSSRLVAIAVPIASMFLSDALIGGYDGRQMAVVYACLALPVFMRRLLGASARPSMLRVLGVAALASIAFFLFTNLAVWAFGTIYTKDLVGFARCYSVAVPFFRLTLGGDLLFSGVLFGTYLLATRPAAQHAGASLA